MKKKFEISLTGAQLRAARALLNLSAVELAEETKVSLRTIRRAEQVHGPIHINAANAERIISILEKRGVQFLFAPNGDVGVTLRLDPPPQYGE